MYTREELIALHDKFLDPSAYEFEDCTLGTLTGFIILNRMVRDPLVSDSRIHAAMAREYQYDGDKYRGDDVVEYRSALLYFFEELSDF